MVNPIVIVNVSETLPPAPNELQKTGALISQGGTSLTAGATSLLTQLSDLTPLLVQPAAITSISLSTAQIGTVTTTQVHGLPANDLINVTIAGSVGATTPNLFNGTFAATVTGTSTFTFPLTGTAQNAATPGTWQPTSALVVQHMAATFFAQGGIRSVYVLELGYGNAAQGVAFLDNWIAQNPTQFYSYLVPRIWDGVPSYLSMLSQFEATTAKTYFFTTTTLAGLANYTSLMKSCFALVETPAYGVWPANALTALSFSGAWAQNTFTALTWSATGGGQITATTTTAHGVQPGQTVVFSGSTPSGYNGTFVALPGTTGSTIIVSQPTTLGVESGLGQLNASIPGTATATTTTAHGVLPGQTFTISGSVAATIPSGYNGTFTALTGTTGSTLVWALPINPGSESVYGTLVASYYASAGAAADGEFTCAAPFYATLAYDPSSSNRVTPTSFKYLFDVTPYPLPGNGPNLVAIKNAATNYVGTGAEGGISTAVLFFGTTKDGNDFTYWYSVDWTQINLDLNIANAVIEGSNDPLNPLYYNQDGINRLQQVAATTMSTGVTDGLVLGTVTQTQLTSTQFTQALDNGDFVGLAVVNAEPFVAYSQENPSDYSIGKYAGLSVVYTPARGFTQVVVQLNVTNFVAV